ncbi:hypothetical protein CASFOL_018055 [Castilleja foliolosa]|uniref:Uncharacterized protein n=1 Tax=Castilleja foliolosa TaxID=1961234 RepID=A0ABD3DB91_9LAMI
MTKSFTSYVDLKKAAMKYDAEAGSDLELGTVRLDQNLTKFLELGPARLPLRAETGPFHTVLFGGNEPGKRDEQEAFGLQERIPCGSGPIRITNGIRKKLKELMMMAEYKETMGKRYYTVTRGGYKGWPCMPWTTPKSTGRDIQSTGPESQSSGLQSKSSGHQSQSTHIQSQSSGHKAPSASPQEKPAGNQTQSQAPNITSFGLRDEETNSGTQTNDTDPTTQTRQRFQRREKKTWADYGKGLMKAGSYGKKIKIEGKKIDVQNALDPCIDHMQIHLDVNMDKPGVKQCVIDRLKNSSRQQRYRLHHQSEANSNNRKKMKAKHVTGRTPFTIIQNEISLKNGDCDMIELYKYTHENVKGKWSSDVAKKNWDVEKSEQEIVTEVVGRANGYIEGFGYGPKPPGKQSQLQQELEETRAELGDSKTEAATYKSKVDAMNEQLKQ